MMISMPFVDHHLTTLLFFEHLFSRSLFPYLSLPYISAINVDRILGWLTHLSRHTGIHRAIRYQRRSDAAGQVEGTDPQGRSRTGHQCARDGRLRHGRSEQSHHTGFHQHEGRGEWLPGQSGFQSHREGHRGDGRRGQIVRRIRRRPTRREGSQPGQDPTPGEFVPDGELSQIIVLSRGHHIRSLKKKKRPVDDTERHLGFRDDNNNNNTHQA